MKNHEARKGQLSEVAILRLSAIGDVVLCAAMALHLAKSRKFKITWITTNQTEALLGEVEGIDFIIVPKPKNLKTFIECRKILENRKFDFLLLVQASFSAHLVSINIKSKRKIGFDSKRSKDLHHFFIDECVDASEEHFVDAYFSFSTKLGLPKPSKVEWSGLFTNQLKESLIADKLPPKKIIMAINPSASKDERNWDEESYAKVINYAQEQGIKVVVIGGSGLREKEFNKRIAFKCEIPPINITGETKLEELPYLLKNVDFLLAPDTGTIHIARAVGIPVIGLYAVANPFLTGPYQADEFSVNKHAQALIKFNKSNNRCFYSRVHDQKAMALILVDEVIERVDRVLKSLSLN